MNFLKTRDFLRPASKVRTHFIGLSIALMGLTACGGGGGSDDSAPVGTNDEVPPVVITVPVAPPAPLLREFASQSLPAQYSVKKESNVRYAEGDFGVLDVWSLDTNGLRPPNAPLQSPVVVVLHGGGWAFGDKSEYMYEELSRSLSAQGFVVFNANYVLTPCELAQCVPSAQRAAYPAQLTSQQQIINWVYENAARYGGNNQKISLVGVSAGGHIAFDYAVNTPSGPALTCIGSMSAPLDLVGQNAYPALITQLLGYFAPTPEQKTAASVLQKLSGLKNVRSVWLYHGQADDLIPFDEATKAQAELMKSSVGTVWTSYPRDIGHAGAGTPDEINYATSWLTQECQ